MMRIQLSAVIGILLVAPCFAAGEANDPGSPQRDPAAAEGDWKELAALFKGLDSGYRLIPVNSARVAFRPSCKEFTGEGYKYAVNGTFFNAVKGTVQLQQPPNAPVIINGKWVSESANPVEWKRGLVTFTRSGRIEICQLHLPVPGGKEAQFEQIQAQCGHGEPLRDVLGGGALMMMDGKFAADLWRKKDGQYFGGPNAGSTGRAAQNTALLKVDGKTYILQMLTDKHKTSWERSGKPGGLMLDIMAAQNKWISSGKGHDPWDAIKLDGGGGFFSEKAGCSRRLNNPTAIYIK